MDKFIGYSFNTGFVVFDNANEALAQHHCYLHDLIYIGYELRFVQHLVDYLTYRIKR